MELREIREELRKHFLHGHSGFTDLSVDEMELHSRKNKDYAYGGDPLGNFRRVARILEPYGGLDLGDSAVVALVYALKQLDAVLWMLSNGYNGEVEGITDRLVDISVYAKLVILLLGDGRPHTTTFPFSSLPLSLVKQCES